ncbi:DUF3124 domain-containing protein [Nostoc sp. LEGE 06077]|uniref:DUF3124 domain-containing protein n=1 Tax=Nostoc sp. LEGE 06077 TaxID=915325 RepID=UPI00187F7C0D|nr:DUF3124 domain-containing protein [Nostoc sp. LEGE 06077]MBE9207403.1 DUF3124 domain-containing protein [Nostoc sp. LEGE 06077]
MKFDPRIYLVITVIFLAACQASENSLKLQTKPIQSSQAHKIVTLDKNFRIATGQTIYVPIYSEIYHHNRQEIFNLAATLSIRNTDVANPLIITSVRYYDSNGKLIEQYLENPIQLEALASTEFFVNRNDSRGGVGANFIVEWVSSTEISEPIVEAVMIGTDFQQGISFISPGKVIRNKNNAKNSL